MTEKQAKKIAIECMKKVRKVHIFNANCYKTSKLEDFAYDYKIVVNIDSAIAVLMENKK